MWLVSMILLARLLLDLCVRMAFLMCWSNIFCNFFFFVKQKTAYRFRISDWSSDVCSSDLALVLPSSRHLSESVETNRKVTIVFDTINSLRRFTDWNALALRDPQADFELSGPASGVGAKLTWTSDVKQVGKGSWNNQKRVVQGQGVAGRVGLGGVSYI